MSSVLSEALAGFGKSLSSTNANATTSTRSVAAAAGGTISPLEEFVSNQLLPLMIKLQKEVRARRFREIHIPMEEAVVSLKTFRDEEGISAPAATPPSTSAAPLSVKQPNSTASSTTASRNAAEDADAMDTATEATSESTLDGDGPSDEVSHSATSADTSAQHADPSNGHPDQVDQPGEAPLPSVSISLDEEDDEDQGGLQSATGLQTQRIPPPENSPPPALDDPQTREPVHSALIKTTEALIAVLGHPNKTVKTTELALEAVTLLVGRRFLSGRAGGQDDTSGSGSAYSSKAGVTGPDGSRPPPASLLHRLLESISKSSDSTYESVQTAVTKALRTILTSPKCGVHEGSMLMAMRSTFHVYLVTKSNVCKEAAKAALLDMIRSVFSRMEAYNVVAKSEAAAVAVHDQEGSTGSDSTPHENGVDTIPQSPVSASAFASQFHADSFALFRSLCKLSSKELPVDHQDDAERSSRLFNTSIPTDPLALSSKILSLELILAALDCAGDAFCDGDKFIYLVQRYLCVSLLKNCVSNQTQVAYLSQKIFLYLVYKFKGHLKQEIEVFMSNIFLRVLESPNSSFKQKALVLESLRSLCGDPVLLTQIFLNYDCDFDAMNLYKDIVHMLTRLGGKTTVNLSATATKKDFEQEFELSLAGLEVLVTIFKAFLKALGLPGGESGDGRDDSAGARIRGMLQLDVGLAASPDSYRSSASIDDAAADELSNSDRGYKASVSKEADAASSADVAGKIVDAFEMKRNAEQNFEIGAVKFTLSLKTGLRFFFDNGFVECDAREVALFFLANKDKLDKTQMGEVLGKEPDAAFVKEDGVDAEKGGSGFFVRVLHHYVDAQDFSGLLFDEAIRQFLSGFRLPGEAQKIDRIMEKFAERFTAQNPSVFPSADTAFILAFSVIMLNTDLHNPSIKPERRMTIESFLRNNRGIGENGGDLPEAILTGIFERIKQRPFSLKEDDAARERVGAQKPIFDSSAFLEGASFFGTGADERRRENFKKEREEMMAVTEQLIRRRPEKNSKSINRTSARLTDTVAPADVVKPMFDVTWGPMIGILSQVLECAEDERSVAVCLNGFVYAVRIASHSQMSLARDTFVSSLAKFTFLGSIKEMKRKNVESIRTLLSIAVIDGEYLGESWGPVLQCISHLAKLRLSASGLDSDESFLVDSARAKSPSSTAAITPSAKLARNDSRKEGLWRPTPTRGDLAREAEESNGRAVLEAVQEVLIDKVFSSTVKLSAKSLAHFIEQLIAVSSSEIGGHSNRGSTGMDSSSRTATDFNMKASLSNHGEGSSIFSLQRLVEVADYNMDVRPRVVWAQVWEEMADYFAYIACHDNVMVSVFAIDSLKQLSLKFLEKEELLEFNFQRTFLKPFLVVMENRESREDIRELVLRCIDIIIRTRSHNLRSGWKIVFSILTCSASDPSDKIEYLGLAILQRLLDEHLDDLCSVPSGDSGVSDSESLSALARRNRNADAEDFVGLCRASLSFVQKAETDSPRPIGLSMRAFCHTAIYADLLAARRIPPPVSGAQWEDPRMSGYSYSGLEEEEALEMVLWRPLFEGLAAGIRSSARNSSSGVGCLVPRASLLALRAILLRHGHLLSTAELAAVLEQTILPSIQTAAENDRSPVVDIISESPSVSSIDFLADALPLPPPPDHDSLRKFEQFSSTPSRRLGSAELLLEASFTDLRHGGDGDLTRAYILAQKASQAVKPGEQPFPDSWLATTAPITLGLITDMISEIATQRGHEGIDRLWPILSKPFVTWCIGYEKDDGSFWRPCEALARISCRELGRLARFMPGVAESNGWSTTVLGFVTYLLEEIVKKEATLQLDLLKLRRRALAIKTGAGNGLLEAKMVYTPYGSGRLIKVQNASFHEKQGVTEVAIEEITLSFGAVLYRTTPDQPEQNAVVEEQALRQVPEVGSGMYWEHTLPALKVSCVSAHCLQQALLGIVDRFVPSASVDVLRCLLDSLEQSSSFSATSVENNDLSTVFQEALITEWGDEGVQVIEESETAIRMAFLHGSAMFFLTQESGAALACIHMLSLLYLRRDGSNEHESRNAFAESRLFQIMKYVFDKFLESERKEGPLIDPNVWRNASESGGKVALYCTSFAVVVVQALKTIRDMRREQFDAHKQELLPSICSLVLVHSEEIRQVVHDILIQHVSPMLIG